MRCRAGGVLFSIGPEDALLPVEREAIAKLDPDEGDLAREPFRIELLASPPWTSDDPLLFPGRDPAVLRWEAERLLASHASFVAEIDPFAGRARLHRREERAFPLEVAIRAAMMARLPLDGGLPLHAAGVVMDGPAGPPSADEQPPEQPASERRLARGAPWVAPSGPGARARVGRGVVFFGPSGAGKTTVASTSPFPVLSDELVAVVPGRCRSFDLVRSGFWGARPHARPSGPVPLALLVDLARGPRLELTRLRPAEAAGRLLASVPVPLAPSLWSRVVAVAAELVLRVPVYRMEWTPAEPPWEGLAGRLGLDQGKEEARVEEDQRRGRP